MRVLISKVDRAEYYKIEVKDKYNDTVIIYEKSPQSGLEFARKWVKDADRRKSWRDGVGEYIDADRLAGRDWS